MRPQFLTIALLLFLSIPGRAQMPDYSAQSRLKTSQTIGAIAGMTIALTGHRHTRKTTD